MKKKAAFVIINHIHVPDLVTFDLCCGGVFTVLMLTSCDE